MAAILSRGRWVNVAMLCLHGHMGMDVVDHYVRKDSWNVVNLNSVTIFSGLIGYNDLSQELIMIYVLYSLNWNSIYFMYDIAFMDPMHRNKRNVTYHPLSLNYC